jgi:hypothetical protein
VFQQSDEEVHHAKQMQTRADAQNPDVWVAGGVGIDNDASQRTDV